nr:MAG TPA: hypothetical protein [Caudoviricetes sp.]
MARGFRSGSPRSDKKLLLIMRAFLCLMSTNWTYSPTGHYCTTPL